MAAQNGKERNDTNQLVGFNCNRNPSRFVFRGSSYVLVPLNGHERVTRFNSGHAKGTVPIGKIHIKKTS